jgi:hypothetical protein
MRRSAKSSVAELIPQAELVLVPRGGHAYAQTETRRVQSACA